MSWERLPVNLDLTITSLLDAIKMMEGKEGKVALSLCVSPSDRFCAIEILRQLSPKFIYLNTIEPLPQDSWFLCGGETVIYSEGA